MSPIPKINNITRRKFLQYSRIAALASATTLGFGFSQQGKTATPPNILLIVGDDLGPMLGCYGDAIARSPNIDFLASQGVRFINSYVTNSSCSSSRSSIYTGLYPHQTGFFLPKRKPVGQIGLAEPEDGYEWTPW